MLTCNCVTNTIFFTQVIDLCGCQKEKKLWEAIKKVLVCTILFILVVLSSIWYMVMEKKGKKFLLCAMMHFLEQRVKARHSSHKFNLQPLCLHSRLTLWYLDSKSRRQKHLSHDFSSLTGKEIETDLLCLVPIPQHSGTIAFQSWWLKETKTKTQTRNHSTHTLLRFYALQTSKVSLEKFLEKLCCFFCLTIP